MTTRAHFHFYTTTPTPTPTPPPTTTTIATRWQAQATAALAKQVRPFTIAKPQLTRPGKKTPEEGKLAKIRRAHVLPGSSESPLNESAGDADVYDIPPDRSPERQYALGYGPRGEVRRTYADQVDGDDREDLDQDDDQVEGNDQEDRDQDDDQYSMLLELSRALRRHDARSERQAETASRSRQERYFESILDGSDISDVWSEGEQSDEEELNFALEEEQMQARHMFPQEELAIPDCEDVGQLQDWDEQEREDFVRLVRAIDKNGLGPVIRKAVDAEAASGSSLGLRYQGNYPDWRFNSRLTLCCMAKKVIGELTYGNLALAVQRDRELRERLEKYQERSKQQPSIYARVHVSQDGSAMSVRKALRLVKWLQRYASEELHIVQHEKCRKAFWLIDREFSKRWSRDNTDAGHRRSLMSKSGGRSDDRLKMIKKFTDQLHARCQAAEEDSLLSPPLLYIGYALRADNRQRQHEACGSSSNWLASLVQAMCNVLWGRGKYLMQFFVICPLSEEPQGPVAEMLLTRVTAAYYHGGTGFCIDIAGKSMESIHFNKLLRIEAHESWAEHDQWVEDNTPVNENWDVQNALMERKEKEKERREEYLTRLARVWHMSKHVLRDPSSPDYEQLKSSVDEVNRLVDKVKDAAAEEQAAKAEKAAKAARDAARRGSGG
jgi:hypothetical protein